MKNSNKSSIAECTLVKRFSICLWAKDQFSFESHFLSFFFFLGGDKKNKPHNNNMFQPQFKSCALKEIAENEESVTPFCSWSKLGLLPHSDFYYFWLGNSINWPQGPSGHDVYIPHGLKFNFSSMLCENLKVLLWTENTWISSNNTIALLSGISFSYIYTILDLLQTHHNVTSIS